MVRMAPFMDPQKIRLSCARAQEIPTEVGLVPPADMADHNIVRENYFASMITSVLRTSISLFKSANGFFFEGIIQAFVQVSMHTLLENPLCWLYSSRYFKLLFQNTQMQNQIILNVIDRSMNPR